MKRLLSVLCTCCIGLIALLALDATAAWAGKSGKSGGAGKVCLCHVPPGNPGNAHTICVGAPAVSAHLNHGDSLGECTSACGGEEGILCPTGQFCKTEIGVCSDTAEGVCHAIPGSCPDLLAPVCGCDGTTYDNACLADVAGVPILHAGACACEAPVACGGTTGATCAADELCKRPDGTCDPAAEGVCEPLPGCCPTDYLPVCGCDGTTYSNACFADAAGIPVDTAGVCPQGAACGGEGGAACATGEFCNPPVGACTAGAAGHCATIPPVCSTVLDPVCGCDGATYDNACKALVAGIAVDHQGACDGSQPVCGGVAGTACAAGSFCSKPEGACAADAEGVCAPLPTTCPATIDPVCGCDGVSYTNACVADAAGVAIRSQGSCVP